MEVIDHPGLVARLSRKSVDKHFDAYTDVDWEAPEHAIDPTDARFELDPDHGLGRTAWYRSRPGDLRAQIGLHFIVHQMRTGFLFENILSRGLLQFAASCPSRAPELRYAYHEVIEESQHSLMFQEFVRRSGLDAPGLSGISALGARLVPGLGRSFPELFFLFVLGGEAPIDYTQRDALTQADRHHPLLRRIMRIHVLEEARHLCFAGSFLRDRVPKLSALRMFQLRLRTPFILRAMVGDMLRAPAWFLERYQVPRAVAREAWVDDPIHRERIATGLAPVRALCAEIGIITPRWRPLWRRLGLLPPGGATPAG